MNYIKRLVAVLMLLVFMTTSGTLIAGETGRKNTRNALGAFTVIEAVKGHRGAALAGAVGTIAAQHQLDKSIRKRHERTAYLRGYRHGHAYGYYGRGRHGYVLRHYRGTYYRRHYTHRYYHRRYHRRYY